MQAELNRQLDPTRSYYALKVVMFALAENER